MAIADNYGGLSELLLVGSASSGGPRFTAECGGHIYTQPLCSTLRVIVYTLMFFLHIQKKCLHL